MLVRGEGCHVWDRDGRRYLDATSGAFCATFGYSRPDFVEAMTRAAERLPHAKPSAFDSEEAEAYRAELLEVVGAPFVRVLLTSSGSEAVDAAIKIAIAYQQAIGHPERTAVRSLSGHYHGATLGALGVTGWDERRAPWVGALGARNDGLPQPGDGSAAFIAETVAVAGLGVKIPSADELARRRQACDASGALWIADEVLTGFGRCGAMFACGRLAESGADGGAAPSSANPPDLIVFGKGAGAGFAAVAGVLVAERVADGLFAVSAEGVSRRVLHQQTYGGSPISCAVGRTVLRALQVEGAFLRARQFEERLRSVVTGAAKPAGTSCVTLGALAGFETNAFGFPAQAAARGLLIHGAGARRAVLAPPLVMSNADWYELGSSLEAAVRAGESG